MLLKITNALFIKYWNEKTNNSTKTTKQEKHRYNNIPYNIIFSTKTTTTTKQTRQLKRVRCIKLVKS